MLYFCTTCRAQGLNSPPDTSWLEKILLVNVNFTEQLINCTIHKFVTVRNNHCHFIDPYVVRSKVAKHDSWTTPRAMRLPSACQRTEPIQMLRSVSQLQLLLLHNLFTIQNTPCASSSSPSIFSKILIPQ